MCGDCCTNIWSSTSPERIVEIAEVEQRTSEHPAIDSATFIAAHWTPLSGPDELGGYRYACRRYDAEHQRCSAWDDRPQVCRGFPWYDGIPAEATLVHSRCSYLADVPPDQRPPGSRPLIPLQVL